MTVSNKNYWWDSNLGQGDNEFQAQNNHNYNNSNLLNLIILGLKTLKDKWLLQIFMMQVSEKKKERKEGVKCSCKKN